MVAGRWTSVGNLRGPRGHEGPDGEPGAQGLPGANAIPTDEAVAEYITTPGTSATKEALGGQFTKLSSFSEWSQPNNAAGSGPGGITVGAGAAANVQRNTTAKASEGYLAMGRDALGAATRARSCIAIGPLAMGKGNPGFGNLAIGTFALTHVQGVSEYAADMIGSRNIGIGSLAGHFLNSGSINTLIGRDSGHSITTGSSNVAVGYRALSCGTAPVGLSGLIENQTPTTAANNTALGTNALTRVTGNHNVGVGNSVAQNLKNSSGNVVIGSTAAESLGVGLSEGGKVVTKPNIAANYTQGDMTITVTAAASGVVAGNKVGIKFTSGPLFDITTDTQWLTVATVTNGNTFTLSNSTVTPGTGTAVVTSVETAAGGSVAGNNTIVGTYAMGGAKTSGGFNVAIGDGTGQPATGAQNTMVGARSAYNLATGDANTALGYNAGRANMGGGGLTGVDNVTCVGANAGASASNQVQLGDAATTTYVYGTVQNRSDIRDKADVRDTALGLDFIAQLRPVDYRWDIREDYFTEDADGNRTMLGRDGSKKRVRYHHGFIAQEVQELGNEFGGLQDHSINGGADVLSIGYDELIAPLVKAVQELSARINELERQEP